MSEISPNALSLEDSQPSVESLPTSQDGIEPDAQIAAPDDDTLPEGVTDPDGKIGAIISAERKRVRAATEKSIRERELVPLQQKAQEADALRAAMAEFRPIIEQVRQYGLPKPPPPSKAEELVSDEEAAAEARDLELYDAKTGQPDLTRAKRIIARRRQDTLSAAQQAAQAAVGPITSQNAQQVSKQNFAAIAMQRDTQDQPLVDPKALAEAWVRLPPELTAHAEVGELIRDMVIGQTVRTKGHVPRAERGPTFSEPAGGRTGPSWQMDHLAKSLAKHAGISDKDFTKAGQSYTPGATNVIGD